MSSSQREPLDLDSEPASRPLPAAATIAVAGFSAALVIAAGVLVAERFEPRRSAAPLAATPLPSLALPAEESGRALTTTGIVAAPTIAPAAASAPEAAIVATPASAPAAIVAAPTISAAPGAPATLAPDRGYLVLTGAAGARSYVNGADVGPSEERIAVPCGARYVRIGTPVEKGRPTTWVTAGRSVVVACRGETKVDLAR